MSRAHPIIVRAGFGAALLGTAAGVAEIVVGSAPYLGNKNDPTTLGVVTILLALIIGAAGLALRWATTTLQALAVATAMLVPALLGMTTAGAAWLPAGVVASMGGIAAVRYGVELRSVRRDLNRQWPTILLALLALIYLALIYLALGITARGLVGACAVFGSVAIAGVLTLRHRSATLAARVLVAGVVPFGVVAWSSVVAPLTAILTLVVGLRLILAHPSFVTYEEAL